MRAPSFVIVFGAAALACAPARSVESPAPSAATASPPAPASTAAVTEEDVAARPAITARPRLSQTLTLGQGADPVYMPYEPSKAAAGGSSVVVNSTDIVQNGGGYPGYGYGYGGYRGGGGRTGVTDGRNGRAPTAGGPSTWSTTGWEGARRTAAPGQTPGVGGNWSPPASYGPAQMK